MPAGVGIALAVGLGVAAFQLDLPGYRFGWRQVAAVTAAAAAVVGMLPVLAGSLGGRWDLVPSGYAEATTWMAANKTQGDFRVLWLGDPRVLPGNGWSLSPGLAYAVSENGLPDVTGVWPGSSPGQAAAIGDGVRLARSHATVRLGRLLAPYAVRYVVVVDTLAPSIPGLQTPISLSGPRRPPRRAGSPGRPAPGHLPRGLRGLRGRRRPPPAGGANRDPASASLSAVAGVGADGAVGHGGPAGLAGWRPALVGPPGATSVTGRVPAGTVLAAVAPAAAWRLTGPGGTVEHASTSFGYAATFPVARPGPVTVAFVGSWAHGVEIAVETAAWVVVAAALAGRRWWLDWWWGPLGRRGQATAPTGRQRPDPGPGGSAPGGRAPTHADSMTQVAP